MLISSTQVLISHDNNNIDSTTTYGIAPQIFHFSGDFLSTQKSLLSCFSQQWGFCTPFSWRHVMFRAPGYSCLTWAQVSFLSPLWSQKPNPRLLQLLVGKSPISYCAFSHMATIQLEFLSIFDTWDFPFWWAPRYELLFFVNSGKGLLASSPKSVGLEPNPNTRVGPSWMD